MKKTFWTLGCFLSFLFADCGRERAQKTPGELRPSTSSHSLAGTVTPMQPGSTVELPAMSPGPTMGSFQWSSVPGAWWQEMMRKVDSDLVSPYNSANQALFGTGQTLRVS